MMMTSSSPPIAAPVWPEAVRAERVMLPNRPSAPVRTLRVVPPVPRVASPASPENAASILERSVDREYLRRGGLACGDELLNLVRTRCDQPISRVARWIVGREIVQYRSGSDTVYPLFQFDVADMSVLPTVREVTAELASVLDDMDLAHWFVRPNLSLNGEVPADALRREPQTVIDAARADRFIMRG